MRTISNREDKPKKTAEELVIKMRDEKGITFRYTTEKKAAEFFRETNNYLRTASYRKNYDKAEAGKNKGKYIDLDFAYLQELSVIDMYLRFIITEMCLDIEHALKVKIVADIEKDDSTDGYDIVNTFLSQEPKSVSTLETMIMSPFTGDLIKKYFTFEETKEHDGSIRRKITDFSDCPAWILVEILQYGNFLKFYDFYYGKNPPVNTKLLHLVRSLRNAAAHNNCIISNLEHSTSYPPAEIKEAVKKMNIFTLSQRQKKLSTRPILEFTTMLYVYNLTVTEKIRTHRIKDLKELFHKRMIEKKPFFEKNEKIVNSYRFVKAIVDNIELLK